MVVVTTLVIVMVTLLMVMFMGKGLSTAGDANREDKHQAQDQFCQIRLPYFRQFLVNVRSHFFNPFQVVSDHRPFAAIEVIPVNIGESFHAGGNICGELGCLSRVGGAPK
jgi:hypothetical protein